MHNRPDTNELLAPLLGRLEQLGLTDVAQRLRALMAPGQGPTDAFPTAPRDVPGSTLLSLADAAELLGLRSPSTVLALAGRGVLEAFQRDGQPLISRRSVEHALGSPALALQRRIEAQLWSLLGDRGDADT
jgi:hypothetical protein